MMVFPPVLAKNSWRLMINDDTVINFYALWPIYSEEMNFKLARGVEPFLAKLEAARVTELIDVERRNTCKRRFWPFGSR
jgi:hypothetical protein